MARRGRPRNAKKVTWSPEPWEITQDDDRSGNYQAYAHRRDFISCRDYLDAMTHEDIALSRNDMFRAVACVNALSGVPKPEGIHDLILNSMRMAKIAEGFIKAEDCTKKEGGCLNCAVRQEALSMWKKSLRACGIEP